MDNNNNSPSDKQQASDNTSETAAASESTPNKPTKRIRRQATEAQLSNPFHGVKLAQVLERLVDYYGWAYLGDRVNIRCFIYNPTMKSSLGFLRRTTWAREHVEDLYLDMLDDKEADKKKGNETTDTKHT